MPTDLYTFVHKAQRVRLFALSEAIARADYADPADVECVRTGLHDILAHLREHAAIEAHYIHPLYHAVTADALAAAVRDGRDRHETADEAAALGAPCASIDAGHAGLEREMTRLEALAAAGNWARLHRAYNGFLGRYLAHLEEEEAAQEHILWKLRPDSELQEVFARFQRERAPEKAREDLEFFLPALSAPELARMLLGMKQKAPEPVFAFAFGLGERRVAPEIWTKVKAALA